MRRRRCFGVALLLQASIGFAATTVTPGPCGNSAPVFSVVADAHHIIALTESLPEGSYGAPTFTISGNTIEVHRAVAPTSVNEACVTDSVDLGTLAAGAYHLVWTDVMPVARTSTFDFAVGSNVAVGTTGFLQPADFQALPPLTPTSPVRIVTNYCAMNTKVAAGVANVHGSSIDIDESIVDGAPLQCEQLYDLGLLPAGKYTATLRQTVVGAGGSTQTYTQHFIVQQPSPTASCDPANVSIYPIIRVTPTAAGTAHLHFEAPYGGHAPQLGTPAVGRVETAAFRQIVVYQILSDTAGPTTQVLCHAEDLDLGALAAGTYQLEWEFGGSGVGTVQGGAFMWSGTSMQCSTTPQFSTFPAPASSMSPTTLLLSRLGSPPHNAPTKATVSGNVISVSDFIGTEISPPPNGPLPPPSCVTSSVTVGPLAPDAYSVKWRDVDLVFPRTYDVGTFALAVGSAPPVAVPLFSPIALLLVCGILALAGAVALRR